MDETEQKILDAALSVFAREGYEGATTRRIAKEADVSEMTLFRKFQSKENILRQVIIKKRDEALQTLDSMFHIEKEADLRTGLRSLNRYILKAIRDSIGLLFIAIEEGRRKPEIAEMSISVPQMAIELLSEYFDLQIKKGRMRDIDTRAAALAFLSYPYYINLLNEVYGDDALGIGEEEFEVFIDIFAEGIENTGNMKRDE